MNFALERNLLIVGGLAGELNLQDAMDRRRWEFRFRHYDAHRDHGKLRAARHLQHVKIAVAVLRVKRPDGRRDREIALSSVTNTLAARLMADPHGLVQRVRHMIAKRRLPQNPLAIRSDQYGRRQ